MARRLTELALHRETLPADLVAGLTEATASVPDAIASAVLAGVSPVHGLYALMVATPVGALATSSVFMNVSITSAMAVAVGSALADVPAEARSEALVVLTILIGLFQLVLGLLRLGGLTRFVSNAVMTGFLAGLAVLIILGQLGDLTGYRSAESNKVLQAVDLLLHPGQVDLPTLVVGVVTIALILLAGRTPLRKFDLLVALVAVSALVSLLGWNSVQLVGGTTAIPRSLPSPALPNLAWLPNLLAPAVAVGIIGLIQGAGVGQGYANPDGEYPDASGDFAGQGIANVAAGFLRGMPVGGALSGTALLVNAGARSRWANIFAGLFVVVAVLLLGNAVELLPTSALAGVLIFVGAGILVGQMDEIVLVWGSSPAATMAMVVTFVATLAVPLVYAIYGGVVLSLLMHLYTSSAQVRVVELAPVGDDDLEERPAPAELASHRATVLRVYGSAYFAAVSAWEHALPATGSARCAVLILNLRGRDDIGSTYLMWLRRYAPALRAAGNRLMLAGVSEQLRDKLVKTDVMPIIGAENVFGDRPRMGASTYEALAAANAWIAEQMVERDQNDG